MIYLDNAATTPISPKVLEAMMPYFKEEYGNAGTLYGLGRRAAKAIAKARKQVADFIGAAPEQIIFTSGGAEANNLAIKGCRNYLAKIDKKHIMTSQTEHDSVLRAIEDICKPLSCNNEKCIKNEFYATYLPVNNSGQIPIDVFNRKVHNYKDIGLVSVMGMNNEVGAVNDIRNIGLTCRGNGILFHTDCVQAAGIIELDVNKIMCDFMTISSHKIHGPKGVGALYVHNKEVLSAIINGGAGQEFGIRGGTENVAGIVGFGKACEIAKNSMNYCRNIVADYKSRFYDTLQTCLLDNGLVGAVQINGALPQCRGKTMSLTFKGVDAESLVLMADTKGVCISAGSACRSHESHPSRVLLAIGLDEEDARCTVRISFSEFNTSYEVDRAAQIIADCVRDLKRVC